MQYGILPSSCQIAPVPEVTGAATSRQVVAGVGSSVRCRSITSVADSHSGNCNSPTLSCNPGPYSEAENKQLEQGTPRWVVRWANPCIFWEVQVGSCQASFPSADEQRDIIFL